MGKAILVTYDFFDEIEVYYSYYRLREMGFDTRVASVEMRPMRSKGECMSVEPEVLVSEALDEGWDLAVFPGGYAPDKLRRREEVLELARRVLKGGGVVVSICHAAWIVISAGLADGRKLTGSRGVWDDVRNAGGIVVDEPFVEDRGIVSTRTYRDFPEFWPKLERYLKDRGLLKDQSASSG